MIWVGKKCQQVTNSKNIFFATDNKKIFETAKKYNFSSIMTSKKCLTGTDRVCEVASKIKAKYYINIQGDEPVFNPVDILTLIKALKINEHYSVFGGYTTINKEEDFRSVSIPKLVLNQPGELMYISRAGIPINKKNSFVSAYRQVCAYAFKYESLLEFSKCQKKTLFEEIEDIEILRFLELGIKVKMIKMTDKSIAIDVKEDLKKLNKSMFYVR